MAHRRAPVSKPHLQEDETNENESSELAPLSLEEECKKEKHNLRVKLWKASPFAVGLTESSWMDERSRPLKTTDAYGDSDIEPDHSGCLCCSAKVCPLLGAGRVGNMAVLRQSQHWVEEEVLDEETGILEKRKLSRTSLDIVVGPYWPMLVFVTYPLILVVTIWAFWGGIKNGAPKSLGLKALWLTCTIALVVSLAFTGCRDPGILRRQATLPDSTWRWSDQAQTYRPPGAYYDPDTAVVVEDFDHTCPWTGTAIGKRNLRAFHVFVFMVFVCLLLDVFLLTGVFG
ncbi:hypothetical protein FisN_3Lh165 [Fistulifera solaris]|uniref:Palmitoyltransferase n=1 Tax=Fistulifera solaris TaxID=1519565 RepID=A0A1Z5JHV5_FISSO|nr:hypothetical protein FisN_3Lh165 [Fistulifera solaris]|eukprot:GAX13595.1 hypothetical protein FisN_3Lh165 [Fistulifera solaris]